MEKFVQELNIYTVIIIAVLPFVFYFLMQLAHNYDIARKKEERRILDSITKDELYDVGKKFLLERYEAFSSEDEKALNLANELVWSTSEKSLTFNKREVTFFPEEKEIKIELSEPIGDSNCKVIFDTAQEEKLDLLIQIYLFYVCSFEN